MVTRRYFLVGLASTVGSAAYSYMLSGGRQTIRPRAADSPGMAVVPLAVEANYFDVVSSDFSHKAGAPFVLSQDIGLTNPVPFRVSVQYDGRIFAPLEVGIVACLDRFEVANVTVDAQKGAVPSVISYDVPDVFNAAVDAVITLSLPLAMLDSYPSEGVDNPLPLALIIFAADGTELARTEWAPSEALLVTAWGAEVSATWTMTGVVDGAGLKAAQYRYPQTILCSSVGPADIPAGALVTVNLDPNVIEACQIVQIVTYPTAPTAEVLTLVPVPPYSWTPDDYGEVSAIVDGALQIELTMKRPVPMGSSIEISLRADEKQGDPLLVAVVSASATLTGPDDPALWQRASGKYNATDLTSSGTPQVADSAQGNI